MNLILILPLQASPWAVEFTTVSLLPAAAAAGDIAVMSLVGHSRYSTALVLSLLR